MSWINFNSIGITSFPPFLVQLCKSVKSHCKWNSSTSGSSFKKNFSFWGLRAEIGTIIGYAPTHDRLRHLGHRCQPLATSRDGLNNLYLSSISRILYLADSCACYLTSRNSLAYLSFLVREKNVCLCWEIKNDLEILLDNEILRISLNYNFIEILN